MFTEYSDTHTQMQTSVYTHTHLLAAQPLRHGAQLCRRLFHLRHSHIQVPCIILHILCTGEHTHAHSEAHLQLSHLNWSHNPRCTPTLLSLKYKEICTLHERLRREKDIANEQHEYKGVQKALNKIQTSLQPYRHRYQNLIFASQHHFN